MSPGLLAGDSWLGERGGGGFCPGDFCPRTAFRKLT